MLRRAFKFGYRDHPEGHDPTSALKSARIRKRGRPKIDPFTTHDAEGLIAAIHRHCGEAQGNYDEFRFFTGLRPSEQVALVVSASIQVAGRAMRRLEFDPTQRVAWRERQVIFNGDTLADIAEDFNRYNRAPRIRVEGDELRGRRYSGAFDADDPESLVEYLRRDGSIAVDHLGEELVIRKR